ncbi:hypothetical protein [Actinoplanes sp. NPDC049118]|uniref:hypothetical protein n=1 Tax=Actinoplanes sp. NPDC049118 TaxID=3155769 RepID=UPI0033E3A9EF
MTELERRYASLLRLYPAAYRRARGAEMLGVLMDSAPQDRRRPEWREVRELILGAIRVRAGAQGRRTPGQSWRVALRTAALILLTQTAGDTLWRMMFDPNGESPPIVWVAASLTVAAACVLAIVAVFRGAYLAAAVVTAGAFVLQMAAPQLVTLSTPSFTYLSPLWQLPLVVLLLIPLIGRGTVVAPRALNLMLLVPVVSVALDAYGTLAQDPAFQAGSRAVWQGLAVAAILWSVVDERVAMAFGLAFLNVVVNRAMLDVSLGLDVWSISSPTLGDWSTARWTLIDMGILAILPILDIAVGATVAVRRTRI